MYKFPSKNSAHKWWPEKKDKSVWRNFMCTIPGMNYAADLNLGPCALAFICIIQIRRRSPGCAAKWNSAPGCMCERRYRKIAIHITESDERLICMTITRPGQLQLFAYCNTRRANYTRCWNSLVRARIQWRAFVTTSESSSLCWTIENVTHIKRKRQCWEISL